MRKRLERPEPTENDFAYMVYKLLIGMSDALKTLDYADLDPEYSALTMKDVIIEVFGYFNGIQYPPLDSLSDKWNYGEWAILDDLAMQIVEKLSRRSAGRDEWWKDA